MVRHVAKCSQGQKVYPLSTCHGQVLPSTECLPATGHSLRHESPTHVPTHCGTRRMGPHHLVGRNSHAIPRQTLSLDDDNRLETSLYQWWYFGIHVGRGACIRPSPGIVSISQRPLCHFHDQHDVGMHPVGTHGPNCLRFLGVPAQFESFQQEESAILGSSLDQVV